MKKTDKKRMDLQWRILIGIIAGIVVGIVLERMTANDMAPAVIGTIKQLFSYGGDVFLKLLRMVIVPLVFASLFTAVINMGNIRELGRIGGYTIGYYFLTTAVAVFTGLVLVNLLHPGMGLDPATLEKLSITKGIPSVVADGPAGKTSAFFIILDTLTGIIPENIGEAFAQGNILQIIFFAIFCAVIAGLLGDMKTPLTGAIAAIERIMHKAVVLLMEIAPVCIFFLVAGVCAEIGFAALGALAKYAMTVMLGLLVHSLISLPLLVFAITRKNPFTLFKSVLPALMTAWSTASSAATLPVTMECLKERAKLDERINGFVVTLGATINMDGTALYESVAVIFIAELMGVPLTLSMQLIIFVTATLAAVGAAAIPGAGLVTMGIVLTAVGLPLEGIGLILAIDRILDQFRTTVNVWGDVTAAAVVNAQEAGRV